MLVEVGNRHGAVEAGAVQRRLEQIPSASRVIARQSRENRHVFEVETAGKDGFTRADIARAIVEAGWDLNELRPAAVSLEEVFLQLTKAETTEKVAAKGAQ